MEASTDYKGTPKGYMAPEIHRCHTDKDTPYLPGPTDVFALGVVFFALLVGRLPFEQATESNRLYRLVKEGKVEQFWAEHPGVGKLEVNNPERMSDFKALFMSMVGGDSQGRPSCEDVLEHPWLK